MIYAIALLLALLPALAHAQGQTTTIPTSTTTLPQSGGVPGVLKQPVISGSTSSVTASPDVFQTGTLALLNDAVTLSISGHTGAGFLLGAGFNGTLVAETSGDNRASWQPAYFIGNAVWAGSLTLTGLASGTGGTAISTPQGTTDVRVRVAVFVSGSATGLLTATTAQNNYPHPVAAGLTTTFGPDPGPGILVSASGGTFHLPVSTPIRLGGTTFTLRAAGTFTPPVVTATQPPQPVMTFSGGQLPSGFASHFVIDAVTIRIHGGAAVATTLEARLVKRRVFYASTQTAAPAAGAVPTGAGFAYNAAGNAGGTYQYKYVAVDIWGNEGNYSAASANVAPAAANGVTVTCPAVPAGAAGYNIYRTVTGPGATWFFVGRTNTTTYRDITPDSALVLAAGTIGAWGTLPDIVSGLGSHELVMEKFVALANAPAFISTKTFPGTNNNNRVVAIAPGTGVGRYRIPGEVESKAFLTTPTITTALARDIDANYTYGHSGQINAAFGDLNVNSFDRSDASMGGTFVVWAHELVGVTEAVNSQVYNGVGTQTANSEGTTLAMRWVAPPAFARLDELAVEIGASATAASTVVEVMVTGRVF